MTNEDFVTYETAKALKKIGFNWPCSHYYTKGNAADNEVWLTSVAFSPEDWNNGRNSEPAFLKPLCSAPTLWQAQKWLRETKGIAINVIAHDGGKYHWSEVFLPNFRESGYRWFDYRVHPFFPTYESALSDGLTAALKLIEEENE